jgi:hypothetical protein
MLDEPNHVDDRDVLGAGGTVVGVLTYPKPNLISKLGFDKLNIYYT